MANESNRLVRDASNSEDGHCELANESGASATIAAARTTGTGGSAGPSGMSASQPESKPIELLEVATGSGGASPSGSMAAG